MLNELNATHNVAMMSLVFTAALLAPTLKKLHNAFKHVELSGWDPIQVSPQLMRAVTISLLFTIAGLYSCNPEKWCCLAACSELP